MLKIWQELEFKGWRQDHYFGDSGKKICRWCWVRVSWLGWQPGEVKFHPWDLCWSQQGKRDCKGQMAEPFPGSPWPWVTPSGSSTWMQWALALWILSVPPQSHSGTGKQKEREEREQRGFGLFLSSLEIFKNSYAMSCWEADLSRTVGAVNCLVQCYATPSRKCFKQLAFVNFHLGLNAHIFY